MRPENFDVDELIDSLIGTPGNIEDHLPEGMEWSELTKEDHAAIDVAIFCCDTCGYWCKLSEIPEDDLTCIDCIEKHEDDSD